MSATPTNVSLNDTIPAAKPDAFNVEAQAGVPYPDPNVDGVLVRDTTFCYRTPQVGGVFVLDDTFTTYGYQLSAPDSGQTILCNSSSPITIKFPATVPILKPAQGLWNVRIKNIGTGTITIDPNGISLDGSTATFTLAQGSGFGASTDGAAYWTTDSFRAAVNFVDEVPSGTINGSNTAFTLSHIPNPTICLELESDGTALAPTVGYTISGVNLTLVFAPVQTLIARYRYLT